MTNDLLLAIENTEKLFKLYKDKAKKVKNDNIEEILNNLLQVKGTLYNVLKENKTTDYGISKQRSV